MTLPFAFPDWMPAWLQLVVAIAAILVSLAFLAMPFSVFGVKGRLDALDGRLEELQAEIRRLALRLPEPATGPYDTPAVLRAAAASPVREPVADAPPIPPASWQTEPAPREVRSPTLRAAARLGDAARDRAEPRLGRPR